jgi:hypothetical protein
MKSNIKPVKIRNNPTNTEHNKERLEFYTLIVLRTAKKSQLWQNKKILENKNKNPKSENSQGPIKPNIALHILKQKIMLYA